MSLAVYQGGFALPVFVSRLFNTNKSSGLWLAEAFNLLF